MDLGLATLDIITIIFIFKQVASTIQGRQKQFQSGLAIEKGKPQFIRIYNTNTSTFQHNLFNLFWITINEAATIRRTTLIIEIMATARYIKIT